MGEGSQKTFVFDLDGTICTQTCGGDDYAVAQPMPLVVDCVRRLYALGHRIVIYTARGMSTFKSFQDGMDSYRITYEIDKRMREMTRHWLEENGVPYDELVFGKPSGDYYIDDKGMSIGYLIEMLGVS